jgi:large subunit ribosomal protein L29
MDVRAIREMSDEQILDEVEDLKQSLFNLRFQEAAGNLENQNVMRYTRRDIARLKTVLRERQLAADAASKEKQNG